MATDSNANTVKIAVSDVIDMASMNQFNSAPIASGNSWTGLDVAEKRHQIVVLGAASDTVELVNGTSGWTKEDGTTAGVPISIYDIWNHNVAAAQLLINSRITVNSVTVNASP